LTDGDLSMVTMTSEGGPGSLKPCILIALTRNLYSVLGDKLGTRYVVCCNKYTLHRCDLFNDNSRHVSQYTCTQKYSWYVDWPVLLQGI